MEKALVIIDGNSLMNRAYYAIQRPMITGDGMYTQGIFGFLNMLNKILTDYEPEYISVAFDRKAPTFRHLEYKEYKAGRKNAAGTGDAVSCAEGDPVGDENRQDRNRWI